MQQTSSQKALVFSNASIQTFVHFPRQAQDRVWKRKRKRKRAWCFDVAGLTFLTLTQYAKEQQPAPAAAPIDGLHAGLLRAPPVRSVQQDEPLPLSAGSSTSSGGTKAPEQVGLSTRGAMLVCVVGGIAGAGWSPLSTHARAVRILVLCNVTKQGYGQAIGMILRRQA